MHPDGIAIDPGQLRDDEGCKQSGVMDEMFVTMSPAQCCITPFPLVYAVLLCSVRFRTASVVVSINALQLHDGDPLALSFVSNQTITHPSSTTA
eukprot:scaffold6361_cov193-Alexandrium_tamarense.AAC.10